MAIEIFFKLFSIRSPLRQGYKSANKRIFIDQFKTVDEIIEQRKIENTKLIFRAGVDPFRPF